jgi:ribonuclease HI
MKADGYGHTAQKAPLPENVTEMDIFTDGSEKEGAAGSGVVFHTRPPTSISVRTPREQTNNNAELYAIEKALTSTPPNVEKIRFFTDSQYAISAIQTNEAAAGFPAHNVPNRDTLYNIKVLIHKRKKVQFLHVYSHVKGKLAEDNAQWQQKIDQQREMLPFHYPTVCVLNDLVDLAARKGSTMAPISLTSNPHLYPLSKVVIHDGVRVSLLPCDILKKRWTDWWLKPMVGGPKRRHMTEALDMGIYGFLLRATHMTLPLRDTLYGVAKGKLYNTPYCEWCTVHLGVNAWEDLEHCLTVCLAHTEIRVKAREEVTWIASKLSSIPPFPTSTAYDWLGYLAATPMCHQG